VLLTTYYSGVQTEKNGKGRHVASVEERRDVNRVLVGNLRERDHFENLGVDGEIVFKSILNKLDGTSGLD
jgi:hypothetical protein